MFYEWDYRLYTHIYFAHLGGQDAHPTRVRGIHIMQFKRVLLYEEYVYLQTVKGRLK
jgi:hypothetical protein